VTNTWTQNLPQNVTLQSDLNGNLTNDGLKSFFYDAENQLTNITVANQWKTEFVYDGFGRRRMAKDYGWQGGAWVKTNETRYVYDGLLAIQERDANNATLVTYTRGLDLSGTRQGAGGIGGLLARTDGNGSAFYHADGSGNVTALMNSTGELVARYLYDPFGNLVGKWGPLADANRYRFSSKEVHPQSGLYYYGFRFYEPNLQRWLNQDPLGEGGGINLYGFVGNNPLNFVDPYGLAKGPVPGPLGDFAEKGGQAIWEFLNQAGKAIDWAFDETIGRAADWLDQKWRDSGLPVPPEMSPEEQARFDQMLQMAGMVGPLKCKVKVRGSYTHTFESNIQYIGKGTKDRPSVSGKQIENKTGDKLIKTEFEPSKPNTDVQAFKDEAQKIRNTGGIPNDNLYNKINSPGEKMLPPSED
jgi:RHS repeat-associated protein